MSTDDSGREGSTGDALRELAAQDRPVVTERQDPAGTADDPDAIDSVTGRPRRGGNDPGTEAAGVAGAAAAGGAAGMTGMPGMGIPLTEGARQQGADRAEAAGASEADDADRSSGSGS